MEQSDNTPKEFPNLKFNDSGLIPVVVQDRDTGQVLMVAWMNHEALARTLQGPYAWFYSRSRQQLWRKGDTSGSLLKVSDVYPDCDGDVLLVVAQPSGPACHTGKVSCFEQPALVGGQYGYRAYFEQLATTISRLAQVVADRKAAMPEESYTARLMTEGLPRIAQKVVEEAGETAIAACVDKENLAPEVADLLYHIIVLLVASEVPLGDVAEVLERRANPQR